MARLEFVLALLAPAALTACVERAVLSPPVVVEAPKQAKHFTVRREGSTIEVVAGDVITGDHVLTFDRFDGVLLAGEGAADGTLQLVVDLRSMKSDAKDVEEVIKNDLLEVEKFPDAALDAAIRRGDGEERTIAGNLRLHGVSKGIRFTATIHPEEDGYRIGAEFKVERQAFGIHAPKFDSLVYDDLRLRLDLLARP